MIWRLLALFTLLAGPALAEVAVVKGGEHPEFTRIVIEAAGAGDWQLGRAEDGYELGLGPEVTGYDLSRAFEKIPKDRVSGLWRDPDTGRLRIALSCACHAIAFEFRPGIVVVDVKSGPPPKGSGFELALDPAADTPAEAEVQLPEPAEGGTTEVAADPPVGGYNWLDLARDADPADLPDPSALADMTRSADLDPLREALLEQISRGAAAGVVGIAEHPKLPDAAPTEVTEADGMRASVGEMPGVVIGKVSDGGRGLAADGTVCTPDSALAIQDWHMPGTVAEQLGPARSGLLTEFDAPVPQSILRAARAYLSVGFGAEARQYLALLPDPSLPEAQVLLALTYLVDQEGLAKNPFEGMESCDGAASLWAVMAALGSPAPPSLPNLNTAALARSFSALPVPLRRHLAPTLVEFLLSRGEEETARLVRDATHRAPGEAGPEVSLMDARYDLATGQPETAHDAAEALAKDAGPVTAAAVVTMVEAAFSGTGTIAPDVPDKLAAFATDARGTEMEGPLRRALVLAEAMSGDFAAAFAALPDAPDAKADLWHLAATQTPDDLFLTEAILAVKAGPDAPTGVRSDTALAIAGRLMTMGFAEDALRWLGPVGPEDAPARRLLSATASLALRDARAALATLSGMDDPDAERLRAQAVLQLGDPAAAAEALDRAGDAEASDRARVWTQDWASVADDGPAAWTGPAGLVTAPEPADAPLPEGPLARGAALVDESAAARESIEALLLSIATAPES